MYYGYQGFNTGTFSKLTKRKFECTCQFSDGLKAPNLFSTVCVDGFYGSKKSHLVVLTVT